MHILEKIDLITEMKLLTNKLESIVFYFEQIFQEDCLLVIVISFNGTIDGAI